ncbi:hypothetical protein [Polynucleobacter sp. MWH-UH35A]|uniref:hypothetical protein n=1 Tax=Polynucleobacter sp. MWH-UH35A TaxID=1855619 RepID=UPI001BFD259A|nr:hypothetical protein [Polynucleobacter sp. MWH-UH35A]QWD59703.1 hypothetical protein ICV36_07825 [Polynucleobacter sp. MWH-UH35A]
MLDATSQSRQLQLSLKIIAIVCGCILLLASAHSNSASLDLNAFLSFIASQVQNTSQLQWLCGIIFLSAGIFFIPIRVSKQRNFLGDKELSNDSYVLYLVDKYQIEKNLVLDQHIACNKIFPSIHDALTYVHLIECPLKAAVVSANDLADSESLDQAEESLAESFEHAEAIQGGLKNPFIDIQNPPNQITVQPWDEAKRLKVIGISGAIMFTVVLGSLFYANSNSNSLTFTPKPVAPTSPVPALSEAPNSDQVVSGSISTEQASAVSDPKESTKPTASVPINERWVGSWIVEGSKLKLVVNANQLRLNDEDFTWVGTRPKGVVECCLAFYEGTTNKSDLLARISGAQEPGGILKPDAQKTLALVNGLSDGNFKRIVLADPYLKKYFFIYDQNYVYRISRDLGDKVDVVIEQFKKQE